MQPWRSLLIQQSLSNRPVSVPIDVPSCRLQAPAEGLVDRGICTGLRQSPLSYMKLPEVIANRTTMAQYRTVVELKFDATGG